MRFFSVSVITVFCNLETRDMKMMIRGNKSIARLMARYSWENVRVNVTLQRIKLKR